MNWTNVVAELLDPQPVEHTLVPRQCRRTRTASSRCTRTPSSRSIARRAPIPIDLTIRPPAPIRIPFCDSVSVSTTASIRTSPSRSALDRLDLDLDRVRHLLARAGEHLLADELGEHHLLRLVGVLAGAEVERAGGQQSNEALGQLRRRRRRCGR